MVVQGVIDRLESSLHRSGPSNPGRVSVLVVGQQFQSRRRGAPPTPAEPRRTP
ncbi:hypothetical protein V7x_42770 [Crateriforma conspicua]|uniref:Uncharacterized protein n=1 Tax=Crateriforma conspicua TaxID=2527996 RepID=A0A5C6FN00_9PLAN|nr:hypothetical protein V7x_42770 [Crateriforma conspicua]